MSDKAVTRDEAVTRDRGVTGNKKSALRWAPVGILLLLALIAPLFGDSPTAVVMPLLLAMIFASVNITAEKKEKGEKGGAGPSVTGVIVGANRGGLACEHRLARKRNP